MANISANAEGLALNWLLGGATPTRPASWFLGLALGAPTSVSGSEVGTASGYSRATVGFNSVASGGSASNTAAVTFGPFSSAQSISGLALYDTNLTLGSGNIIWYGTLVAPRTVSIGDTIVLAAGQLSISLS